MVVVEMTPEAQAIYDACRERDERMLEKADRDPLFEAWVRGAEMSKRIALVVACGRHVDSALVGAVVDEADMRFAARLVDWSLGLFVTGLRENMAENDHEAGMKLVLRILRRGGSVMTRSDLYRRVDGRLDARQLDGVMKYLTTSGQVEELEEQTSGRPKRSYRMLVEADA